MLYLRRKRSRGSVGQSLILACLVESELVYEVKENE